MTNVFEARRAAGKFWSIIPSSVINYSCGKYCARQWTYKNKEL
jgi:hypothetical protein